MRRHSALGEMKFILLLMSERHAIVTMMLTPFKTYHLMMVVEWIFLNMPIISVD
jgi:hypothetical protein